RSSDPPNRPRPGAQPRPGTRVESRMFMSMVPPAREMISRRMKIAIRQASATRIPMPTTSKIRMAMGSVRDARGRTRADHRRWILALRRFRAFGEDGYALAADREEPARDVVRDFLPAVGRLDPDPARLL